MYFKEYLYKKNIQPIRNAVTIEFKLCVELVNWLSTREFLFAAALKGFHKMRIACNVLPTILIYVSCPQSQIFRGTKLLTYLSIH